ncbi:MAG: DNA polymerase III subunit delta' [Desulfovibrio sp.]|jgi:DNA polymerase-3 subunit delta'|nr:DNA polymerase III subunit delta' [Desulfovibrio sp.]
MSAPLPSIAEPAFDRLTAVLRKLVRTPPQVLILEGGREDERIDAARYWAACCNCPRPDATGAPCLACPVCRRFMAGEHPDMYLYDGRIRNKEDQENPGIVRAFTVENTRLLKRRLHDMPRGEGRRVVIIMGIDQNRDEAANAMLKLLEDPLPGTVFVLLAPQREQLLPTLVSRSFCLTLPWSGARAVSGDGAAWEKKLADFLREGKGFLEDAAARGAVDALAAENLLLACQKACGEAFPRTASDGSGPETPLGQVFAALDTRRLTQAVKWIFEAQDALRQSVTPARVLEALAVRLFVLRAQKS